MEDTTMSLGALRLRREILYPLKPPPSAPGSSDVHVTTSLEQSQPVTTSVEPTPRSGDGSYPEVDRQAELEKVREENNKLVLVNNEIKQEIHHLKLERTHNNLSAGIYREKVIAMTTENANLKMENIGLKKLVKELQASQKPSGHISSKFLDRLQKTLQPQYHTLAKALQDNLFSWCLSETMEVVHGVNGPHIRNWHGRVQSVTEFGLELLPHQSASASAPTTVSVPFPFHTMLEGTEGWFLQSFVSYQSVIETQLNEVLDTEGWEAFTATSAIREETVSNISTNSVMVGKVKQYLQEAVSNRKRCVIDDLYTFLLYSSLRSAKSKRRDMPVLDKTDQIKRLKNKVLKNISGTDTLDFSHWRSANINDLTSDGSTPDFVTNGSTNMDRVEVLNRDSDDEEGDGENDSAFNYSILGIHRNEISIPVWIKFLGYNPLEDADNITEISFLSITRLDAWIATAVILATDKPPKGGGRQREFIRQFHNNFSAATYQFVHSVYQFVKYWLPAELTVGEEHGVVTKDDIKNLHREATVILYSPVDDTYYIAVKSAWFSEYISPNFGIVHDCFIAKLNTEWDCITELSPRSCHAPTYNAEQPSSASVSSPVQNVHLRQSTEADVQNDMEIQEYVDYELDDSTDSRPIEEVLAPETVPPMKRS